MKHSISPFISHVLTGLLFFMMGIGLMVGVMNQVRKSDNSYENKLQDRIKQLQNAQGQTPQ